MTRRMHHYLGEIAEFDNELVHTPEWCEINEAGDRIGSQVEKCTYNGKQDRRQKRPMGRLGGGAFDAGSKA